MKSKKIGWDWQYGHSPAPKDWQETADIIKKNKQPSPKKSDGPSMYDRLSAIEDLLKKGK